ncbi:MAG: hypothetical protein IJA07_10545 [Agathobacter sp.]|nr:hypothetical protein [Agathobacter sp.]MBQ3559940.1 hypothetical protein [Agathobacter sp.]
MKDNKILKVTICTIVMLGLMLIGGNNYMYNNGLSGKYVNTEPKEGQIKVACVGDSITYGHGVSGWKENNYPAVLQELLGEEYHVANFGSSGACVNPEGDQPYMDREVYQAALEYDADIIVFMIGTNDSKPENWTDIEGFMEDYTALLGSFLEGENAPEVYVGLCAEAYYKEDADQSTGIASYDIQPAIVDEIAEAIELHTITSGFAMKTVDVHSLTEAHPEWFEADGIHPNNDGAKAIAEAVAEEIQK